MEKMINTQITLDLVAFTQMGKQEFNNQFENAIVAELTVTLPSGEVRTYNVGEIFSAVTNSYDVETGIEIESADIDIQRGF